MFAGHKGSGSPQMIKSWNAASVMLGRGGAKLNGAWTLEMDKLEAANIVLSTFSPSKIERRKNGWYVLWDGIKGKMSRRWQTNGNDFYPVWHHRWPGGGTATTALSQLIRWLRGQPVLPISTWMYWSTPNINLLTEESIKILKDAGYPEHAKCVLCGNQISGGLDWWSLEKLSGPCCAHYSGCK